MNYIDNLKAAFQGVRCTKDGTDFSYQEYVEQVTNLFLAVRCEYRKAFFIGNGGSAAIAIHMTADFLKNGMIMTHPMFDPATITCLANDEGYENVFSFQIERLAKEGDVLIAVSSSGKSANIIKAVETMKSKEGSVLTLSGFDVGNPLRKMGDWNLHVPSFEYGIVESIHNMVLQQIVDRMKSKQGL